MVDLGNDGFTNPIIPSFLEISNAFNPFSSRFPFPVATNRHNVCTVNGLHNRRLYRPFYHLATMHMCKTVGIY